MAGKGVDLDPTSAEAYLRAHGLIPPSVQPTSQSLGGGVSNHVMRVAWDGNCVVLKQPLANLAVDDDWPADLDRVHNEAEAIRAYRDILESVDHPTVTAPAVRIEDEAAHVIGIDCAPETATAWKSELLDGEVDHTIARSLGDAIGQIHRRAASDDALRAAFADPTPFEQLRLDPYHRTTAERHPELAEAILAETDRVATTRTTLVHGDFSPKNVLVDRDRDPARAWLIDFEVAHWGDPAFDVAFLCNHLLIKALVLQSHRDACIDAARGVWTAYRRQIDWDIEADVVAELPILLLARIDGKSPVEYVDEGPVAEAMRRIATIALEDDVSTLREFLDLVREEAP